MALNELFLGHQEHLLVLGARVGQASCEAPQSRRKRRDRRPTHRGRDGLFAALFGGSLRPISPRRHRANERGRSSSLLLGERFASLCSDSVPLRFFK